MRVYLDVLGKRRPGLRPGMRRAAIECLVEVHRGVRLEVSSSDEFAILKTLSKVEARYISYCEGSPWLSRRSMRSSAGILFLLSNDPPVT